MDKIAAIRAIREVYGFGLKDAKDIVEMALAYSGASPRTKMCNMGHDHPVFNEPAIGQGVRIDGFAIGRDTDKLVITTPFRHGGYGRVVIDGDGRVLVSGTAWVDAS